MAGTFSQHCVDTCPESIQNVKGYKCLDRAGKPAAVDTVSTLTLQVMLTHSQRQGHILVFFIACGNDILQVHIRGVTAFLDKLQEGLKITLFQSCHLLGHPGILLVEVDGTEHRTVAALLTQLRNCVKEICLIDLGQHILAKIGADGLNLTGNGSVFIGQIRMVSAGIDDAQGMTAGGKIKGNGFDHGMILIEEVDGHQVSDCGSGLIHQTTGFSEEHILRILADLSNLCLGNLGIKEQMVDDGADQHLISSRRAEAAAGQDCGFAVSVKALHFTAKLCKTGSNATDQCGCGVDLVFLRGQFLHVDLTAGVALGENTNQIGAVFTDSSNSIQIDSCGQNTATLMVGVVAANFCAARCGKIPGRGATKCCRKTSIQRILLLRIHIKYRCGHFTSSLKEIN